MTTDGQHIPSAETLYAEGLTRRQAGDNGNAMAYFQTAINTDSSFEAAYAAAGETFMADGYFLHALDCYARGIHANPNSRALKEQFILLLRSAGFRVFNAGLKNLITLCLQAEDVDFYDAGYAWQTLLYADPGFQPVLRAAKKKKYAAFAAAIDALPDENALLDPYFLKGLEKTIVASMAFERFLTHLRRYLLERLDDPARFGRRHLQAVAQALAQYCFQTRYIFDIDAEEAKTVAALREHVENGRTGPDALAVLGCYMPLYDLSNAAQVLDLLQPSLPGLARLQIAEPLAQQRLKPRIPALTPVEDEVSQRVRAQYEEFPYPSWQSYVRQVYDEDTEGRLRGRAADILAAGCGTGREAIELAGVFPDARVLAVDLSLSSLAYGLSKAEAYGMGNIQFAQADILKLGGIDRSFDFIASSGVLHHIADPFRGWSVLAGLLKPGGLMRVALYGIAGRRYINQAREIIRRKGFGADADSIRAFRRRAKKLLGRPAYKLITNSTDFYTLPQCRDLLFHVQEQSCDIPMLKDQLRRLDLVFAGFQIASQILQDFARRFPGRDKTDLDAWEQYEKMKPDLFGNMYRFWCRKPSA